MSDDRKVCACVFTDANFPVLFSGADVELADGTVFPPGQWEMCFKMSSVYLLLSLFNGGYHKVHSSRIAGLTGWLCTCTA